jgi:hypothetical protein
VKGKTLANLESPLNWRRSRRCETANCVEAAAWGGGVAVRDSKDPDGPVLRFTMEEWTAFVAGVREGDFQFD